MPFTVPLHPEIIPVTVTRERLKSYLSVFQHSSQHQLMACYVWNSHVCSALHPLLSAAEITLRNSVDKALVYDPKLSTFWWSGSKLRYRSYSGGTPIPDVVQKIRDNFSKATNAARRDKQLRYGITAWPKHDDVIAKTDFSTWEWIFDQEFLGPGLIWQSKLGKVLKGPWPATSVNATLTEVARLIKIVREFRNRLSHHEPVWKRSGIHTEVEAIAHLQEKIDNIVQLVQLVSPNQLDLLVKNKFVSHARMICSIDELNRRKRDATPPKPC